MEFSDALQFWSGIWYLGRGGPRLCFEGPQVLPCGTPHPRTPHPHAPAPSPPPTNSHPLETEERGPAGPGGGTNGQEMPVLPAPECGLGGLWPPLLHGRDWIGPEQGPPKCGPLTLLAQVRDHQQGGTCV